VDEMIKAVGSRLLGQGVSGPLTPEEALAWADAAAYLSGRIQASPGEMPGRAADMSANAAKEMKAVLAEIEASSKLMSNRETVVQDIANPTPSGVKGGALSQADLKRVSSIHLESVDAMIRELCGRLVGTKIYEPSTPGEAQVWAEAALFFNHRIQASDGECPGRAADMSAGAAAAMRKVLSEIATRKEVIDTYKKEAAQMLMSNRERVIEDITNPGPSNIDGKKLTQPYLKRVNITKRPIVENMICEVCCCLLGKPSSKALTSEDSLAWAEAAAYLYGRIQGTPGEMPGRSPDMSANAAVALRTALGEMEAAIMLMSNRVRVVQDITNPGPTNIDGKKLTQTNLARVDIQHRESVDAMIREVYSRLLGTTTAKPQSAEEAKVWAEAATYLSGRIQGTSEEMPGRNPDMSYAAAMAMRKVLGEMEAAHKLMSNRVRVVQDITNPGPTNIDGKRLTQPELKRVDIKYRASVDAMIREVCCRLSGKTTTKPKSPEEAKVWAEAATYLSGRIQGIPDEMPGRKPDMSASAAKAMRTVLEGIAE